VSTGAWEPSGSGGVDLAGGRTTGARRIGATVRKPWTASSPAVHAVLRHLAAAGFDGAPRPGGVDEQGRQVLSLLPGDTVGDRLPWPEWVWSEALLADVGRWLRRLHDLTAAFVPPADARWFTGHAWRPGLVIGHHDAAPWNAVTRNGRLVGFVDWDIAGPSSRERDLAFVALTWVPLLTPAFTATLDPPGPDQRSRRLHLLLDAYGHDADRAAFAHHIADRARMQATVIRLLAADGDPIYDAMLDQAALMDDAAADVETLPARFWVRPAPTSTSH
jgi:hypothetical protein